jgi:hypothetical protein
VKFWLPYVSVLLAVVVVSCVPKKDIAKNLSTGRELSRFELPGSHHGSDHYAEVRADALSELFDAYKGVLFEQGLVKWDERADCNVHAQLFVSVAQARFAAASWHSFSKTQALALAEVWYVRADGRSHAIVRAKTERGLEWWEPQTGRVVQLTPAEEAYVFLQKW